MIKCIFLSERLHYFTFHVQFLWKRKLFELTVNALCIFRSQMSFTWISLLFPTILSLNYEVRIFLPLMPYSIFMKVKVTKFW